MRAFESVRVWKEQSTLFLYTYFVGDVFNKSVSNTLIMFNNGNISVNTTVIFRVLLLEIPERNGRVRKPIPSDASSLSR